MNRVDVVSRIRIGIEMENCWRLVGNYWLPVTHESRKVVVFCEAVAPRPGDQDCESPPQRWSVDLFEFLLKIDAAVPDFEGRKFRQSEHMLAICRDGVRGQAARLFLRHAC